MNYLFNLYLIKHLIVREQILGVIIADCIKYSRKKTYDPLVEEGIGFQHKMEIFIKNHPSFNISKKRIDPRYTRYATEIVKIYYSHFLATHWENYSSIDLQMSVSNVYVSLTDSCESAPAKLKKTTPILNSEAYGITKLRTIGGIHTFIDAISRKGLCVGYLQNTLVDLVNNYNQFKEDFDVFMKDFQSFAEEVHKVDDHSKQRYPILANAS